MTAVQALQNRERVLSRDCLLTNRKGPDMIHTMPRWTHRLTTIGVLVSLAALLSGCFQVTHKSVIAPDLTGSTTLRIGVSKTALAQVADLAGANGITGNGTPGSMSLDPADAVQQLGDQLTQLGGTATPFQDGDYVGVDVFFNFSSLDQMTQQLNGLLSGTSGPSAQAVAASGQTGILTLTARTLANGGIRVEGNIDPLSFLGDPNNVLAALSPDLSQAITSDPNAQITLSFQMPGAIRTTDAAARRDGTTATWTFPIGSAPTTLFVESDPR